MPALLGSVESDGAAPSRRFFPRHLLALLAGFRQTDGDGLLAVFDLAGSATPAAPCAAALIAVHLATDLVTGAAGISAFPSFGHGVFLQGIALARTTRACAIGCV